MKKYVAAALVIGITIGPASAVDVGVGGTVGGVGASAGLSAGSQGVSAGVGASADGVGGANAGASASGGGSPGASAGGKMGGKGAGVSAGARVGDHPSAQRGRAHSARRPAAVTTAPAFARTAAQSITLPPALRPSGNGNLRRLAEGHPFAVLSPLKAIPGTPAAVVRACHAAIMNAAKPLGAVRVYAASAGPARRAQSGLNAPIAVRIDYERQGGIEVRQARVDCRLNAAGTVTAVI
ncbi:MULTISPECIES: hypothetical protein [unclassified Mesorhizobium]|uniref:hypothetical protein n=1 Tax=unclassified Mesorhizobium TaxID=325217 RepID=UPI000FC9CCC6|nr:MULTISPECIES: hypothetical protein [unclassified Mesorhizobium]TGP27221.1 hypothetical protein EN874_006250 [Mesorhizobium sp. M1D.F.Ca.ET.231.01.1.1]TGP39179.1 hypothetical protein EN877_06250 [Mesorhizobium sp. M1D.F.Ca.ET.234.01.1.1]TGS51388.1 hypothetical protein EN827_06250 [Mesorhizobium sp. M1D.F.Ca.ET.184.01.1.1]TGS67272.1 hypothetical protein EN826_006250 [Mesorhizobium sp. M1D.F.Ca.ET.183.01.1.1]